MSFEVRAELRLVFGHTGVYSLPVSLMKSVRLFFCLVASLLGAHAAGPIPYAPAPNDPYYHLPISGLSYLQGWYLEGLNENAERYAVDINARSAWSISRGEGVTIAIVDDGVELHHPDLTNQQVSSLHWNFEAETNAGNHPANYLNHGTAVAGLAVAEGNNNIGITGLAPEANFASWVIIKTNATFVPGSQLAKMFEFHNDEVQIQNHSWVKASRRIVPMTEAENLAISNAVFHGRGGLGVVMIRAAGNSRDQGRNVNDDAYTADPRAITVAAVRADGRAASYSTPGAPILVAVPGGESNFTLMSTDRLGSLGMNALSFSNDPALSDYVFSGLGFSGTSASAPVLSGISALMLSANTNLTVRDVQHILVQSAFQVDAADPDNQANGAGFVVNHNSGFGLVNAGTATQLAATWTNVPPVVRASVTVGLTNAIPDAGLQLLITSTSPVPPDVQSILALPGPGLHADEPTPVLPLVYVGQAASPLTVDLTGKAALIQRGGATFDVKIQNAANAGAEFAIMFNNQGDNSIQILNQTDFVTIPAVSISQRHGEALANFATNFPAQAQIRLEKLSHNIQFTEPLITEHVQLHLDVVHEARGDMRVTLVSPKGTRSVLHRFGPDTNSFDGTWIYLSTHHFYESPVGTWRLEVSDEFPENVGVVRNATLEISGIPITDTDRDGLDDDWERQYFGNLQRGATDDPDADGYSNAREQIQKLSPNVNDSILEVDLSNWGNGYVRLNWPARLGVEYEVLGTADLRNPFQPIATVAGSFPRAAWFGLADPGYRFFTVREKQP
jgi:subtilisin-like proprotein convertase family protein/subtilisin family serine protease